MDYMERFAARRHARYGHIDPEIRISNMRERIIDSRGMITDSQIEAIVVERSKSAIRTAVLLAIHNDILVPQPCQICGMTPFEDGKRIILAHHDDYNQPLKVRWLCVKDHGAWHKNNQALPPSRNRLALAPLDYYDLALAQIEEFQSLRINLRA